MKRVFLLAGLALCMHGAFAQNPNGFAMVNGTTNGGSGGTTVTVSNATDFKNYAGSTSRYIIRVSGTINLAGKAKVLSNKTIEGVNTSSTIIGNLDLTDGNSNIIIRNLNITNTAGDGITIWNAHHVYVSHVTFTDCGDGSCDINNGSNYVTVSWCRFRYPSMRAHRFVMIADNARVTLHHNWYDVGCDQRMPASTGGTIHMYNNYFSCSGNSYCTNARAGTEILSQNNYYQGVKNPIVPESGGKIRTSGNVYNNCTGTTAGNSSSVFTPPYSYTLISTNSVPQAIRNQAGNTGSTVSRLGEEEVAEEVIYEQQPENSLVVSPVPTKGMLTISLPEDFKQGGKISMYNLTGQQVLSESVKGTSHTMDITSFPLGIYMLKAQSRQRVLDRKIVKE